MQFILYQRTSPADNFYAHPLDTVVFYDMNTDTIKEFACYGDKEGQQVWGGARWHGVVLHSPNQHKGLFS